MELVVVARFGYEYEAHLAKAWLEANGIEAFVQNICPLNSDFLPNVGHAMIEVVVPEDRVQDSILALLEKGIPCLGE